MNRFKRKWFVQFTVNQDHWHVLQDREPVGRPCWTYRSALRLARKWNKGNHCAFGTFEVYGPLGKEI